LPWITISSGSTGYGTETVIFNGQAALGAIKVEDDAFVALVVECWKRW
jgi:hypothetical protein